MMYAIETMDYGDYPADFPVPVDFPGPFPLWCCYCKTSASFSAGEGCASLLYVLCGTGTVLRAGESARYFSGCMLVGTEADQLMLEPAEETTYLLLHVGNAASILDLLGGRLILETEGGRVDRLFGRLCYHISQGEDLDVYALSAQTYTLLMELCMVCVPRHAAYSPLILQAISLMREDYAYLTGVEELAERLEVSAGHLIRAFSAAVGTPPGRYLLAIKLENARLILQNRDYTIDEVASMTGFSGANYFCKVFRRQLGESPGRYRARHIRTATPIEHGRILIELEQKAHL